jgi:PAS domain-containing protein
MAMGHQAILLREAETSSLDSGVFTWDISCDRFYADNALASLFGLDGRETMNGMPMERYIERVHPDDRSVVARSIHKAIVLGVPCQQNYRVKGSTGTYTEIVARGRCFRDPNGNPFHYAGIVVPFQAEQKRDLSLSDLCAQAHRVALKSGNLEVAKSLRDVLGLLDGLQTPAAARNCH